MLVANLAVLLQLRSDPRSGLGDAVGAVTDKPLGILVVLLFALLLAALITQSWSSPPYASWRASGARAG